MNATITSLRKRPNGTPNVDVMYADFFHGIPRRGGDYGTTTDARMQYQIDRPLHLWKNVFQLGNFFCPSGCMVFSRSLFDSLALVECEPVPVVFDRPYSLEYDLKINSIEFFGFRDYFQQQRFLYSQKGDLELNIGLEFVSVDLKREVDFLKEKFDLDATELQSQREMFDSESKLLDVVGTDYIEQIGILDARNMIGGWLLSPHVFDRLKDEIHPYFFEFKQMP